LGNQKKQCMPRISSFIIVLVILAGSLHAQQGSTYTFDVDHRSRLVYWDEGLFPSNGWEALFSRHRTTLGGTWMPLPELEVRAALTNEFFSWYRHRDKPDFTLNEVFFDNLYVKWKPGTLPLTLTVGRQNMIFGEGFVMLDGGPLDGSRSIYFNAARLDLRPSEGHNITVFGLHQPRQDDLLPLIGDADRAFLEVPTDGTGVYYTGNVAHAQQLDAYYIYTYEDCQDAALNVYMDNAQRHTTGVRYSASLHEGWRMTGEGNVQWGTLHFVPDGGEKAIRGWSWYAYCTWTPASAPREIESSYASRGIPPLSVDLGMYQYSGGSTHNDGVLASQSYDPQFARWPKWSESFIYTLVSLRGSVAQWSNLIAPFVRVQYALSEFVTLRAMLQHLRDAHRVDSGSKDIGTLAILEAKVHAGRGLTGHMLVERMWLTPNGRTILADSYLWGRLELRYRLRM